MPTRNQIIAVQKGRRALRFTERQYRMLLGNVGHVASSKQLDNVGIENVMAVMEDMGFDQHPAGRMYWRDKVARRGSFVNARMLNLIERLAQSSRYCLPALAERFSANRTTDVQQLTPKEAWNLIEMLKAANEREGHSPSAPAKPDAQPQAAMEPSAKENPSVARASRPCSPEASLFKDDLPARARKRRQPSLAQVEACRAQYPITEDTDDDVPF